jgi:hypothetical protein
MTAALTLRELVEAVREAFANAATGIEAAWNAILDTDLTPLFEAVLEIALAVGAFIIGLYVMAQIWHAAVRVWSRVWGDRADAAGRWLWRGVAWSWSCRSWAHSSSWDTMPPEPFEGSLLKLRRARVHIQELQTSIDAYTARKPIYRTARPVPNEPGYLTGEIVVREVPPPEFAVILGDAIHNMRVSLDLLANDLVRIEGESTKNVYFPFAKSAVVLDEQIKNRNFHRAAPEAVGLLRKLAPYPGGNALLRDLHVLIFRTSIRWSFLLSVMSAPQPAGWDCQG